MEENSNLSQHRWTYFRMNYIKLIREVIKLLDLYKPGKQSEETFIEDSAKSFMNIPSAEKTFIMDTVQGCTFHWKLLDVVIDVFYKQKGILFLKAERNLFVVVCYLAVFRLEDLGLEQFSKIIKSLDSTKMYKFLSFFFNVTNLTTRIHEEWSNLYDATFVWDKWIAPLLRWQTEIQGQLKYLEKKTTQGSQPKKFPNKTTKPEEFNLTKPHPHPIPAPELIPQQEKPAVKPVPASTKRAPKDKQVLENIKEKNFKKALMVLYEANTQQVRCANPEKSEKTLNIMSQIQKDQDANLQFDMVHSSGSPATQKASTLPIRKNKAVLLRKEALNNQMKEKELKAIELLVQGNREPSAFLKWQEEMKEKDMKEELVQLECRRLDVMDNQDTLEARQRVLELNKHKAQLKKQETEQLMREYAEKRMQEEKEIKELVQQVADGHKNSKAAKVKLQEIKKRIVMEVSKQNQELLRKAVEEAHAELKRKFELICQIRAAESVHHVKHTFVDDTETGGYGLLSEMSLAELRERLVRAKAQEQQQREKKRQDILEAKQREQLLLKQMETSAARRTAENLAKAKKQEEEKLKRLKLKKDLRVEAQRKALEIREQKIQKRKEIKKKAKLKERTAAHNAKSFSESPKKQPMMQQDWLQLEQALEKQIQRKEPTGKTNGLTCNTTKQTTERNIK